MAKLNEAQAIQIIQNGLNELSLRYSEQKANEIENDINEFADYFGKKNPTTERLMSQLTDLKNFNNYNNTHPQAPNQMQVPRQPQRRPYPYQPQYQQQYVQPYLPPIVEQEKPKKKRKWWKVLLWILGIIILVAGLLVGGYFVFNYSYKAGYQNGYIDLAKQINSEMKIPVWVNNNFELKDIKTVCGGLA